MTEEQKAAIQWAIECIQEESEHADKEYVIEILRTLIDEDPGE